MKKVKRMPWSTSDKEWTDFLQMLNCGSSFKLHLYNQKQWHSEYEDVTFYYPCLGFRVIVLKW